PRSPRHAGRRSANGLWSPASRRPANSCELAARSNWPQVEHAAAPRDHRGLVHVQGSAAMVRHYLQAAPDRKRDAPWDLDDSVLLGQTRQPQLGMADDQSPQTVVAAKI